MKKIIKGRAPLRIDLAGAWSDIPFYCDLYGGTTINAAIDIYTNGQIVFEEDGRFEFKYNIDFPSGSGLGSSGALNVLYYAMINHKDFLSGDLDRKKIASGAYKIERALGANCGKQDQCAAAFGGINLFRFGSKKPKYNLKGESTNVFSIKHQKIGLKHFLNKEDQLAIFSNKLLLIDTKIIHSSSEIINDIQQKFEKDKKNYQLCSIGKMANLIKDMQDSCFDLASAFAPRNNENKSFTTIYKRYPSKFYGKVITNTPLYLPTDWERVGEIISYQFDVMKEMSSKTTNDTIDKIINNIKPYIYGAKPGGAGGGGCIIALCKSLDHKEDLKKEMEKDEFLSNFDYYDINIDTQGVQIWEEQE
jgi:D-glycero-alpha-D-manno-heptose-7-phosphate kinase